MKKTSQLALSILLLLGMARPAGAQWMYQTNILKAGWNGVFLHVDASYAGNDFASVLGVGSPITTISMWNPPSTAQFVNSPSSPVGGTGWNTWQASGAIGNNTLQSIVGDTAYLFYVNSNYVGNYTNVILGQPVTPRNHWNVNGLNFLGFSTVPGTIQTPPVPRTTVLNFLNYLSTSTQLTNSSLTELYEYTGGEISANNPMLVPSFLFPALSVVRGRAYWVHQGNTFSSYFGPFEVILTSGNSVGFSTNLNTYTLTLRNHTAANLTVAMNLLPSLTPPPGQSNIASLPPLILRGALSTVNLQYAFTNVTPGTPLTFSLAPANTIGSDAQVVLGLNRSALNAPAGSIFAGILRFTDSLNFTEVDVPTSAVQASDSGLWVGTAAITNVSQYLKNFALDATNGPVLDPNSTNGGYLVTGVNTSAQPTSGAFHQRLIVFSPSSGGATLLQHVYYGMDANTNAVISTGESALNPALFSQARRISSVDFPWSAANPGWSFSDNLQSGNPLTVTVTDPFDDQISNPFLHTYHPDHDNRDHSVRNALQPTYSAYTAPGNDSYTITRTITLTPGVQNVNFSTLTVGNNSISGTYAETVTLTGQARTTGVDTRTIQTAGFFTLNHISIIPTLTQAP